MVEHLIAAAEPIPIPARAGQLGAVATMPAEQLAALLWKRAAVIPKHVGKAGVYVLFEGNELVYIGQAKNVLLRVGQHLQKKKFTHASFIACDAKDLDAIERALLRLFVPRLNIDSSTCLERRRRGLDAPAANVRANLDPTAP